MSCLCQQYSACGCDDNDNSTFLDSVVGNGTAAAMNSSLARIAQVNGTKTLVLNGTLPNDTTADDVSSNSSPSSAGVGLKQIVFESFGYWVMAAIVGWTVWMT